MRFRILLTLCFLLFSLPVPAFCGQDNVMDSINSVQGEVEKYQKSIVFPKAGNNAKAEAAASAAAKMFYSPEYQKKITSEQTRIEEELFTDLQDKPKDFSPVKMGAGNLLLPDERIYVFISSSVPMSTLHNYAKDIDAIRDPNIVMIMRGFIEGMKLVTPTLKFIQKVITKDRECGFSQECGVLGVNIYIDPLLFRKYNINSVPAIVYVKGVSVQDPGASEGLEDNVSVADEYIVYGDISIEHALEKVNLENRGQGLKKVLKKLKGGYYN